MVPLKTSLDVARIRKACRVAQGTLRHLAQHVAPGASTRELEQIAERYILANGAVPALKGYRGFPGVICASTNNITAHGIPDSTALDDGDVVTVDVTVGLDGWYGDAAWTYLVGDATDNRRALVRAAWRACLAGIVSVKAGGHLGDVGEAIKRVASRGGCSVVQEYVGHGIGRELHEEPRVPNFGMRGTGERIVAGMVFTVEPVVTAGGEAVHVLDDGWAVATDDGSLSAQFEHTVAVYRDGIEILTFGGYNLRDCLDEPPTL